MKQMHRMLGTGAAAMAVMWASVAVASSPAERCQAGKNKAASKFVACRHGAEAKLAAGGELGAYRAALDKCATKNALAWEKLETKGDGACPSAGDVGTVANVVASHTFGIATEVAGGALADCPTDLGLCGSDLAACQSGVVGPHGRPLKTGQTRCYDAGFPVTNEIACAGTGQDGALQKGLTRSYTDNGNGTITDHPTGLMWEKLSDDGTIHDWDDFYAWTDAFTSKIATLNASAFAGYEDWRLPNRAEIATLILLEIYPPVIADVFNASCAPGCAVTTCSCTQPSPYLSGSNQEDGRGGCWAVDFDQGEVADCSKQFGGHVRAVRGG